MSKSVIAVIISLSFAAFNCGGKSDSPKSLESQAANGIFVKKEFADKTLALLSGSTFDAVARDKVGAKTYKYFESTDKGVEAILSGEADAIVLEEPVARKYAAQTPDKLTVLYPPIDLENYAPIFPKKDGGKMVGEFNAFLAKAREDGTVDDMVKRWMDTPDSPPMPEIELKNPNNRVLKLATTDSDPPFSFRERSGKVAGFDVEMAARFAQSIGCGLEIAVMDFVDIIPAVANNAVDFAANVITITEERKAVVDFSEPVYYGGTVVLVRK